MSKKSKKHRAPSPRGPVSATSLAELRRLLGVSQRELATQMGCSQSEISRFELRDDHKIQNLRRYLEGLGCELELSVKMPGGLRYKLSL